MARYAPRAEVEASDVRVGTGWIATRVIGRGGSAVVYEAIAQSGERAALKVLHERWAGTDEWLRRFRREAQIIQTLDHPAIARYLESGVLPDGRPFLVTELLVGTPLAALLDASTAPLSLEAALEVADALLDALEAAHASGVVHRDVTPGNVFVTANRRIKLIDFGVASSFHRDNHDASAPATRGVLGTPAFMAPEQARGRFELVDARTDVWAVGAVLFTSLTRQHVHVAATENEQLGLAMSHPARSLASVRADLDPGVVAVIDRALSYDKERRWRSAGEFRAALRSPPSRPDVLAREVTRRDEDLDGAPVQRRARSRHDPGKRALAFAGVTASLGLLLVLARSETASPSFAAPPTRSSPSRSASAMASAGDVFQPPSMVGTHASSGAARESPTNRAPSSGASQGVASVPPSTTKRPTPESLAATPFVAAPAPSTSSEPRGDAPASVVSFEDLIDGRTPPSAADARDLFEQRF